jgi:hypothetical protein
LRSGNGRQTFILCLLAGLASLRLILEPFVMEEDLFACSPNKVLTTIDALNGAILIFIFGITF